MIDPDTPHGVLSAAIQSFVDAVREDEDEVYHVINWAVITHVTSIAFEQQGGSAVGLHVPLDQHAPMTQGMLLSASDIMRGI